MAQKPALVLIGYGVSDTLQITVESQRVLARASKAYAVSLPPNLERYLKSLRVTCIDLGERFVEQRPFAEAYLEIADLILQEAQADPPVVLLSPGNPLLSNALNRFLMLKARERKLAVQVLPAVSPIDAVVCQTGLDVGTFGLQVFDARRVVAREQQINPEVPLLLLQLAGVAATEAGVPLPSDADAYAPLGDYLARFYPADHTVTHLTYGANRGGIASVPLNRFSELVANIGAGSTLFVDLVRQERRAEQPAKSG